MQINEGQLKQTTLWYGPPTPTAPYELSIYEFHIVSKRPWPLTGAIGAITILIGLIKWFHQYDET
jgi:hypothetical protein